MLLNSLHNNSVMMADVKTKELEETEEDVKDSTSTPWRLILYDDDIHTFDEVIEQVMKAKGCSMAEAETITWKVHNEGKALVHEGEFEECLMIDGVLKEIQLITEIKG